MPIIIIKAILSGLWKRLTGLFRWAMENPWQAALIVSLAACAALWRANDRHKDERDLALAQIEEMKQASAESLRRAKAQKAAVEQRYRDLAKQKDVEHEKELAQANDATDRYISSHRVRSCAGSPTGRSASTAENHSAGVSEGLSPNPLVALTDSDVRACGAAVVYGVKAHEWAISLPAAVVAAVPR